MSQVRIEGLSKTYGRSVRALRDVSLTIPSGSIYGLLGPNGSGKSTLVKILAGVISAFGGSVAVDGTHLPSRRVASQLGYMPQASALYADLTVRENLDFFGAVSGLRDRRQRKRRIQDMCGLLELADKRDTVVSQLSGGMRQRLSLGCALIHGPRLLLLDEPTVGLDPRLRRQFWDYFRTQAAQGVTILITTHVFDEARFCGELGLLRSGVLAASGPTQKLADQAGTTDFEQVYLFHLGGGPDADPGLEPTAIPVRP